MYYVKNFHQRYETSDIENDNEECFSLVSYIYTELEAVCTKALGSSYLVRLLSSFYS